jgi:poly-gamma-glutamate synthesis protein (capsule biosynthesis protein)
VALVPIVSTASAERSIARSALARLLAGSAGGRRVLVAAADLAALAASLRVAPGSGIGSTTTEGVLAAVAADPTAIGVVRATDVTPGVRALAVDGTALFGALRVRSLEAWPLVVPEVAPAAQAFDPAGAWTLVAGGDVMLDRGVYREAILRGKGIDLPWDGGTARIVGTRCCGASGAPLPVGRRSGQAGALRDLFRSADVALANLEGPAPDAFSYHRDGLVFSFDPALLAGLRRAGIDAVSLANNHIANAGATGIAETERHLDALDVGHAGAGRTLAEARRPVFLSAGGSRIALLAYDAIRPDLAAGRDRAGAAPLRLELARNDIRAARTAGADVVIVMPHWGTEYADTVTLSQRREAAALVAAGADAVIGSHSHWAGPIETVRGRPVLYSLGDLVFELYHDRRTLESVVADLTFVGSRLVQLDLHPTLIVDGVQPNLLDPAADGATILADVRRASARLSGAP